MDFCHVFFLAATLGLWLCVYRLYSNSKVYAFREHILDLAYGAAKRRIKEGRYDWQELFDIYDKYTYGQMLYSRRPLTLNEWFTPNEIKLLITD